MKKVFLLFFFIFITVFSFPFKDFALNDAGEELKLYMGDTKIISVSNPSRIAIGNPAVIDVANVGKNEITVTTKAPGKTTLVLWDSLGEQSYQVKVFAENLQDAKRRIDNLLARLNLPDVSTKEEEEEGKILLLGKVKNAEDKTRIDLILGPLKEKTIDLIAVKEEETAVDIEVQLLELDKDATTTLGFSFPGSITAAAAAPTGSAWSSLFHISPMTGTALSLTIDALAQEGKARILSRPHLACQSGKEAELLVGGEKPIFSTEAVYGAGTASNVEYKEFGIKLKIKPTVTEENRIKLVLNVEVSEVGTVESIGATSSSSGIIGVVNGTSTSTVAKAYPLSKRNVSTELYLDDGQTMSIGGLMKHKAEEDIRKTPGLGDIPILGFFFRKKTTTIGGGVGERGDTELFITLTPKIIAAQKQIKEEKEVKIVEVKPKASPPVYIEATSTTPITEYAKLIQKRILDNLAYPRVAKESGFQGVVKLNLHFSYEGKILDAAVKESSGYKLLDDNAISAARGVASYPPFPSSIEQKDLWIEIPIAYRLD